MQINCGDGALKVAKKALCDRTLWRLVDIKSAVRHLQMSPMEACILPVTFYTAVC